MAKLIYRGVEHDGFKEFVARTPKAMTYRGVRHDGMSSQTVTARRNIELRYRGVAHVIAVNGTRMVATPITREIPHNALAA
ncbi:hypothetical protein ATO6_04815 [Oceanicola sp. 22II-s10i]|uniref:DUF4278 domain-containing protein n=1 Tax=Oceanicola sp. 22II-s10i TaxID=1317116 RepID=UPI000B67AD34|nr:DUF4278 domain-containing protein [Oceanicola sp. 22II-s10i]OWU86177.1 hypothetical protein ATO6_04815 [Oceanicola sp. 22II-s10i]